jgi:hypothetical protein
MANDDDVVVCADGLFGHGVEGGSVLRQVFWGIRAANARHLLGVDGVAMSVELSGQSGHMDGGVPCAGDEDNLGFRHGELLRGGMRWM